MRKDSKVTLHPRAASAGCSYFGVRIVRHVRRDMADLAGRGYSGVLHTFSENDLAYRAFGGGWAAWVLDCGVDAVFWAEPGWIVPAHVGIDDVSRWTCRCNHCSERFGGPVPAELSADVQAFREASVVDFLRELV